MNETFILTGGNQGDRLAQLSTALKEIKTLGTVRAVSGIYETAAWGRTDQPDFLNQVIHLETQVKPQELMNALLQIEAKMGRQRTEKYDPRTIDLDILYFNDEIIDEPGLMIPHPRLQLRRFVLEPLYEIAPNLLHPVFGKTTYQLLLDCPDPLPVKRLIFSTSE
jgi:2-amino-4-hydroxy-6-hydroxymethyldihydropteridine diphosphokinase